MKFNLDNLENELNNIKETSKQIQKSINSDSNKKKILFILNIFFKVYEYDFNIEGLDQTLPMAWARMSTYFSLRKKIIGVGIPFLAKAQIYGGAGINSHQVTPKMSAELITNANLDETLNTFTSTGSFDANAFAQDLGEYAKDNKESFSGAHVMVGLQAKLLSFNMIANLRYTMAKDVIPGKSGFPSAYVGLGIGI